MIVENSQFEVVNKQQKIMDNLKHIEKGKMNFGDATKWTKSLKAPWFYKYVTAKFQRQYTSPPICTIAFKSISHWVAGTDKKKWVRFSATLSQVNSTHVQVMCSKWDNAGYVTNMQVRWICFPSDV